MRILVDIVYKEADYQNQCSWFTNMIFDVVEMCYRDSNDLDGKGFKVPHEYLPNVAGHWESFMILTSPEDEVSRIGNYDGTKNSLRWILFIQLSKRYSVTIGCSVKSGSETEWLQYILLFLNV